MRLTIWLYNFFINHQMKDFIFVIKRFQCLKIVADSGKVKLCKIVSAWHIMTWYMTQDDRCENISMPVMQYDSCAVWQLCSMTVVQHDSCAAWQLCSMTVMQYDSYAVWQLCSRTVVHYDNMTVVQYDMTVVQYNNMTIWQYDSMLVWRYVSSQSWHMIKSWHYVSSTIWKYASVPVVEYDMWPKYDSSKPGMCVVVNSVTGSVPWQTVRIKHLLSLQKHFLS